MKTDETVSLTVTHRFAASAERVFDAWLDPTRAARFLFATATGEIVRCDIDARAGGGFTIVDLRNGEEVAHVGTYVELERPRRIVFTLSVPKYGPGADRVSIDIAPLDTGCRLTLTHEMRPQPDDIEKRVTEGWTGILEVLAEILPPDGEPSCGMGLAHHSTVSAKIAVMFEGMAETLELHRTMLDLADARSREEDEVYGALAASYRRISQLLHETAARMAGHRDLPMGAHREDAFGAEHLRAFEKFVKGQSQVLAILRHAAQRDEQMLASMTAGG